ncbi:MAG: hypothetical protein NTW28_37000 [Candidatus Solibacter sp.]|nr:hypothetical protein [Candidatus Solibacter sp.]
MVRFTGRIECLDGRLPSGTRTLAEAVAYPVPLLLRDITQLLSPIAM